MKAYKETQTIEKIVYTSSFFALGPTDGYTADETQVMKDSVLFDSVLMISSIEMKVASVFC